MAKLFQKLFTAVFTLKLAQNVNKHLDNFCKKMYHRELTKIAQSGHTDTIVAHNRSQKDFINSRVL